MSKTETQTAALDRRVGFVDTIELDLADHRVMHLTGIIMPPLYHEFTSRLHHLALTNKKPITIYMNTPGGSLLDAIGLYDVMQEIGKDVPLTMVASGSCMSAGILLLQGAHQRLSLPNTQFMVHELSGGSSGKLSEHEDTMKFQQRLQDTVDEIIAKRCGMTIQKLRSLYRRRDLFLDAKAAKKLNLIDGLAK